MFIIIIAIYTLNYNNSSMIITITKNIFLNEQKVGMLLQRTDIYKRSRDSTLKFKVWMTIVESGWNVWV